MGAEPQRSASTITAPAKTSQIETKAGHGNDGGERHTLSILWSSMSPVPETKVARREQPDSVMLCSVQQPAHSLSSRLCINNPAFACARATHNLATPSGNRSLRIPNLVPPTANQKAGPTLPRCFVDTSCSRRHQRNSRRTGTILRAVSIQRIPAPYTVTVAVSYLFEPGIHFAHVCPVASSKPNSGRLLEGGEQSDLKEGSRPVNLRTYSHLHSVREVPNRITESRTDFYDILM
ncbi:hypothetical protein BDN71DRAFT_251094 [Pleurotus eryngii]|uniref:Uncharacterized protein n=1 Tax=Pleurotus eryngii TaxID=5323 RepID=A0A9P5ZKR7_PLEER|nr:hypothetical protein BDN71DRAFT_251094 [Pleurotus eryngii]